MPDTATHPADLAGGSRDLADQAARHLKKKYGLPNDPAAASQVPIGPELVDRLSRDRLFHQFLRNVVSGDPAMTAFLARLRRALFFGEWTDDDRAEPPVGLMASLVRQCVRCGYALPASEEEMSWVKLLRRELAAADWRAPGMDRQAQLLRLALYKPLPGLPFETSLLIVRPSDWHEQIGALIDDVLRSNPMRS